MISKRAKRLHFGRPRENAKCVRCDGGGEEESAYRLTYAHLHFGVSEERCEKSARGIRWKSARGCKQTDQALIVKGHD
jgi:hypothetical protein